MSITLKINELRSNLRSVHTRLLLYMTGLSLENEFWLGKRNL